MTDDRFEDFVRQAAQEYNAPPETPREEMWQAIAARRGVVRQATPMGRPMHRVRSWVRTGIGIAAILLIGVAIGRFTSRSQPDVAIGDATSRVMPRATDTVRNSSPSESSAPAADPRLMVATRDDSEPTAIPSARSTVRTRGTDPRGSERLADESRSADALARAPRGGAYRAATLQHLVQAEVLLTSFRAESRSGAVDAQVASWARDLLSTTRLLIDSPAGRDPQLKRLLDDLEVVLAQIAQLPAQRGRSDLDLIDEAVEQRDVITRLRTAIPAGGSSSGS